MYPRLKWFVVRREFQKSRSDVTREYPLWSVTGLSCSRAEGRECVCEFPFTVIPKKRRRWSVNNIANAIR